MGDPIPSFFDRFREWFKAMFTDEKPKCGMGYWASDFGYICVLRVEETLCKDIAECAFK